MIRDDVFAIHAWQREPSGLAPTIPLVLAAEVSEDAVNSVLENIGDEALFPAAVAVWNGRADSRPRFYSITNLPSGRLSEIQCIAFDPEVDLFSRTEGILETRILSGKMVTSIAVGSVGSRCVTELARCGVDHFRLVDFDRLSPHNISRHVCGVEDIGRYKTRATADAIWRINPTCCVETFEADVVRQPDVLDAVITGSSLVLVSTDTAVSRFKVN
ncbi:ThiF family adenylyltransferase, partial [Candidatus Sumerlaeota bacterium]|nr:ThiF family adenylyltransferase [Candidatus Sumerlaeota bacterium]